MTNREIKMLIMDVDGTLTDGKIYVGVTGEIMKAFSVKDGLQLKKLIKADIIPVIITGRTSQIVEKRCKELGIKDVFQGVSDKLSCLKSVLTNNNLSSSQVAFIGDDENDLECIDYVGYTACPSDANSKVKNSVDFICSQPGGTGCVAEFITKILEQNQSYQK